MRRPHTIFAPCVLGLIVLGALAPRIGRGESAIIDAANSDQQLQQRGHIAARPAVRNSASPPSLQPLNRPGRAAIAAPRAARGIPSGVAQVRGVGAAGPVRTTILPPIRRAMTAAHFTPNLPAPNRVAGVSGNLVGRHALANAAVGGAAIYDAKKGAVIAGSAMKRKF